MSEIQKAIAWFENRVQNTPMPGAREMFKIALEALREKAERENPEPLTREELAQMDGQPVWVVNSPDKHDEGFEDEWALVHSYFDTVESTGVIYRFEFCGKKWLAYRNKPKEG